MENDFFDYDAYYAQCNDCEDPLYDFDNPPPEEYWFDEEVFPLGTHWNWRYPDSPF